MINHFAVWLTAELVLARRQMKGTEESTKATVELDFDLYAQR